MIRFIDAFIGLEGPVNDLDGLAKRLGHLLPKAEPSPDVLAHARTVADFCGRKSAEAVKAYALAFNADRAERAA